MIRVYLSGDPVHDRVLKAFYEGCQAEKKLVEGFEYEPSDVAVIFGVYKSRVRKSWPRGKVFRQQRQNNKDVIVLETGYINRGDGEHHYYAAGFNGINGRADFRNKGMGDDRKRALFYDLGAYMDNPIGAGLSPYSRGDHILVCGQVPWDASVDHSDHKQWVLETIQKLKATTSRRIVFRPHPLARDAVTVKGVDISTEPHFHSALHKAPWETGGKAHAVVTFNSNSGVEATILGVPVFAADEGSMVWGLANKDLKDINEPKPVPQKDREQWLNDICYAQWNIEEMSEGKAWQHLFRSR